MSRRNKSVSRNQEEALPSVNFRMPKEIAHAIKVDAMKYDLYNGEFLVQMYIFAKKNGFYDWLKNNAPKL